MPYRVSAWRGFPAAAAFLAVSLAGLAAFADLQSAAERFQQRMSEALNRYDPDRQARPAAVEILNANEALTSALRDALQEEFGTVADHLDDAEEALRRAGAILLDVAGQEVFRSSSAERLQGELFFVLRDVVPQTDSDALNALAESCLAVAERIERLTGDEGEAEALRAILTEVSAMRLVIGAFYIA